MYKMYKKNKNTITTTTLNKSKYMAARYKESRRRNQQDCTAT